jgi:hypothetical protein
MLHLHNLSSRQIIEVGGSSVALYRLYFYMYYGLSHIIPLYRVHTYVYYGIAPLNRYHHYLVTSSFLHLKAFNEVQTVKL